jgi:hypothetical protein
LEDKKVMAYVMTRWLTPLSVVFAGLAVSSFSAPPATLVWHHSAQLSYDVSAADETPRWSGGVLVSLEGLLTPSPVIRTLDRQGRESAAAFVFTIPEASSIDIYGIAHGVDGSIALCGAAVDRSGRGSSFLALVSPPRDDVKIIRQSPFTPYRVALAADGTLWAVGIELVDGKEQQESGRQGVIRHFAKSGKEIGSYVSRSTVGSAGMIMRGYFAAGRDRVGWYPRGGSQYFEISQSGDVRHFSTIPLGASERVTGIALTDDAGTYLSIYDYASQTGRILMAANTEDRWSQVESPISMHSILEALLYGADGNDLVFRGKNKLSLEFYTAKR